jgi:hypothetical protein
MNSWNVFFVKSGAYFKVVVAKDIVLRMSLLQSGNPSKIEFMGAISNLPKDKALLYRKKFYNFFRHNRVGNWIDNYKFEGYDSDSETIIYGDGGYHLDAVLEA